MAERISDAVYCDAVYDFYCEFCSDEGLHTEADGFCVQCDVYLCRNCVGHHRRHRLSRHHVVQDKETMPKDTPISIARVRRDISTTCIQHKGELVRFYCKTHDVLICSVCAVENHNKCSNIDIVKQSQMIFDDSEYKDFLKQIKYTKDKSIDIAKSASEKSENFETSSADAIRSFKLFRQEINSILDEIENDLLQQAETHRSETKEKLDSISDTCKAIQTTIDQISSELKDLQSDNRVCQAFIRMKEAMREVRQSDNKLRETEERNIVTAYTFVPNPQLKEYLRRPCSFGTLAIRDNVYQESEPREKEQLRRHDSYEKSADKDRVEKVKDKGAVASLVDHVITSATYVQPIDVRSRDDLKTCWITGSAVLSDNRLVVVDHDNYKVKLVDTHLKKVISKLKVPLCPWDVTVVSTNQVAVTIYNKILVLNVTDVITQTREITVNGDCRGISYSQNMFLVTFLNPPKLEMISLDGRVTRTIEKDSQGNKLFVQPQYVCTSNDGETIYVSDYGADKLISLTKEGVVKVSYSDLKSPTKVCVDQRGLVYICDLERKGVHILTAECNKIKTILTEKSGLVARFVSHCRYTDTLYLGMFDTIKVCQLS